MHDSRNLLFRAGGRNTNSFSDESIKQKSSWIDPGVNIGVRIRTNSLQLCRVVVQPLQHLLSVLVLADDAEPYSRLDAYLAANPLLECSQLVDDWRPFYVERLATVAALDPTSSEFVDKSGIVHSSAVWALMCYRFLNRNNYAITAQFSAVMVGPWTIHVLLAHVADAVMFF